MKIKQKLITLIFMMVASLGVNFAYSHTVNADCGGIKTSIINCVQRGGKDLPQNATWGLLLVILQFMSAGVGILGVGGIVYGAILYASAGDNASQVSQAKEIIQNVVIGLLAFGGMYLFLNFLIPGGIFT